MEPFDQIGRPGTAVWRWIGEFLTLYLPTLVENGGLAAADVEEFWRWWTSQTGRADAFIFAPPILCVIGLKIDS